MELVRVELVLRRDTLRRHRINCVEGLRRLDLCTIARRRLRFVSYVPGRQSKRGIDAPALPVQVQDYGVQKVLALLSPRDRAWFRSRLCLNESDRLITGIIAEFTRSMSARPTPPGAFPQSLRPTRLAVKPIE